MYCLPQPMRGRGAGPPPPIGGPRGAAARGAAASRGAMRGRGAAAAARGRGGVMQGKKPGAKRKAGNDLAQSQTKRRNMQDNWGAQPIAQQPLDQSGYGGGYNDSQWYQDSYGQNWG